MHGPCVEHYGLEATYLPILDALSRLCREERHTLLPELLQRYAPTWRRELPWLLNEAERAELYHSAQSATPQRMLREFAEFIEAVTVERPLVLVLEDLQWSDPSTVALLGYLARRREPARFLIIGTYRPGDLLSGEHPLPFLLQELQAHGYCRELPLPLLSTDAVRDYVARQLPDVATNTRLLCELACRVHERTEGNPLFMVTVVEDLVSQSRDAPNGNATALFETGLNLAPDSVQTMIQQQVARLSKEEQDLLEAASIAGAEFSAAASRTAP